MPYDTPLTALGLRVGYDAVFFHSSDAPLGWLGSGSECVRLEWKRERERIFVGVLKRWVCGNLGFNGRVVGTGDLGLLIHFLLLRPMLFFLLRFVRVVVFPTYAFVVVE